MERGPVSVMWLYLIFTMQLICGCWIGTPVEADSTADTVSRPIRHSLPQELESLYGSDMNGRCTSVSGANSDSCNGTSVLNDGIIPAHSSVNDSTSQWAAQLFTMRRSGMDSIVVSFEVPLINHDRVELAVFNCPERGIYVPNVTIYIDFSSMFLPKRSSDNLGDKWTTKTLSETSCDYLLKFCVDLLGSVSSRYFNLEFPYQNNSNLVFLGEVTFLNVIYTIEQCGQPELITSTVTLTPLPTESTTFDNIDPFINTNDDLISELITPTVTLSPLPTELTTSDNINTFTISGEINTTLVVISELDNSTSLTTTSTLDSVGGTCEDSQCATIAFTAGVISAIVTGLLVATISVAIHIAVYLCVYKPKQGSTAGVIGASSSGDVSRHGDAIMYDVINERVETSLEMKQNEAYYGLTRSR